MEKFYPLLSILFLIYFSCEDNKTDEDSKSTYRFDIVWEDTGITKDNNDYFHLTIDRNNWQTLYRVRGIVKKNDRPEPFMKFYWESNLYWELGDTLGYYIHRGLTDDSNMIAPVKSMIGDTLTLSWYFFDWITGDFGGDGEMSFVLE